MSWIHASQQTLKVQIRWLIHRDMPEVLCIERDLFEFPWQEEDFLYYLRQRNCIGIVAEYNHRIVGFMIYELHKAKLHVLNFAVDLEFRQRAVGTQMVEKLVDKLSQQRRLEIVLEVRESNLAAQLFFKKMGFKAVLTLRSHYDDTDEDAFVMRFRLNEDHRSEFLPFHVPYYPAKSADYFAPCNRITEYDSA
ncbi:MAG: ribosomal-protein-alanine N-acetyltransferase [Candidatus Pacebacteria bacterium]|nr:ribosomal-protein-alanine N-acetyltransferase [Candidatus Paceibacterota bacterium]